MPRTGTGELVPPDEHPGAVPFVNSLFAGLPLAPNQLFPDPDDGVVQFGSENVLGRQSGKIVGHADFALIELQEFDLLFVFGAAEY